MQQYPNDAMTYQMLIWQLTPDVIIEVGTFHGGLTHYFSSVLELVNPEARIVTVDIDGSSWRATVSNSPELEPLRKRVTFVEGNSVDPLVLDQVISAAGDGATVLVLLDSLHTMEHVLGIEA